MTLQLLNIVLCVLLSFIVFQDFKYRAIHVFLVLGVFIFGSVILWFNQGSLLLMVNAIVFVLTVITFLWIYISLKHKKIINPLSKNIGLGDILFFIAVTPLFSFYNYIIFFITGMLLSIIISIFFNKIINSKLVPLAGILSFYIVFLKVISFLTPSNLFYNLNLL